jgi:pyruvate dehydrogenase E2 component (dihydrolipoyllysine-residue acetyltransferase)
MPSEIVMPQLGLTMTEGSVNAWLKQPGERVQKGEMLFTVSTDKVDMEVESTGAGFLNPLIDLNIPVSVGTVIAVLTEQPGDTSAAGQALGNGRKLVSAPATTQAGPESKNTESIASGPADRGGTPASPRARSLAKKLGIDITAVTPGSGNRIVEADVQAQYDRSKASAPEPVGALRRITAERTAQSFERAPHFYLTRQVHAGKLVQLREELKTVAQRRLGFNISYTDFLLRALALALREEPDVNTYWHEGQILARQSIDVGFAAQTEKGLLVPVILTADQLNLFAIATRRKELSDKARAGKLGLQDLQGGGATLSNLGAYSVDSFQAILNAPQSVILATGSIAKRPVVIGDRVEAVETLFVSLSADHRVLDGVAAARFLAAIVRMIQDPLELLV